MATTAKRAKLAEPFARARSVALGAAEQQLAGQRFRRILITDLDSGKLDAHGLVVRAWWHTQSGGCGVEDLAGDTEPTETESKHSSERVERILRKEFPIPELTAVDVPANPKRSSVREASYRVDVQLPS